MAEHPIDLSSGCVRAIRAGGKTLIRSVVQPEGSERCPLGSPGDRLWVREPWAPLPGAREAVVYQADGGPAPGPESWQPAKSLPREHSRLNLEIRSVRRERLQDIPEVELSREGRLWVEMGAAADLPDRAGFALWWDSLHPRPHTRWEANPEVWVLEVRPLP